MCKNNKTMLIKIYKYIINNKVNKYLQNIYLDNKLQVLSFSVYLNTKYDFEYPLGDYVISINNNEVFVIFVTVNKDKRNNRIITYTFSEFIEFLDQLYEFCNEINNE